MTDKVIRIKTTGDTTGSQMVLNHLNAMKAIANDISKNGINIGLPGQTPGSSTQVAAVSGVATMQAQKQIHAQRGHTEAQQELQGHISGMRAMTGSYGSSSVPVPRSYGGARAGKGTIDLPENFARDMSGRLGSADRAGQWFQQFRRYLYDNPGIISSKQLSDYQKVAQNRSMSSVSGFYQKYASEVNMVGNPPLSPGQNFLAGFRGNVAAGGSWSNPNMSGVAGNALSGVLPFMRSPAGLAVGAVAGAGMLAKGAWDTGMKQGDTLSGLTKTIGDGASSLHSFIVQLDKAGAALGYLPDQVAQIASILGPMLGHVGNSGIVSATKNVTRFARQQGLPAEYVAQNYGLAAQMGLTMGAGASTTGPGFLGMVSDLSTGDMKGRSADVMEELLTAAKQIQSMAVTVPNIAGLGNIIAQFNNTGIRQIQGASGAQLLGKVTQGIANPGLGGAGEFMTLKALGAPDYVTGKHWQEQGPSFIIPSGPNKGKTSMKAVMNYFDNIFGKPDIKKEGGILTPKGNTKNEAWMLAETWHMSQSEILAIMKSGEMPGMKKGPPIKPTLTDTEALNRIEGYLATIKADVGSIAVKVVGTAVKNIGLGIGKIKSPSDTYRGETATGVGEKNYVFKGEKTLQEKVNEITDNIAKYKKGTGQGAWNDMLNSAPSLNNLSSQIAYRPLSGANVSPMSISMAGGMGGHLGFNYMMASMQRNSYPSILQTSLPSSTGSTNISPNINLPVISPGAGMLSGDTMKSYIVQKAMSLGLDPKAVLSVAIQEGGFKGAIGDSGSSFGPFQLHKGGALPKDKYGNAQAWANSAEGIDYALGRIATVAEGKTGSDSINAIVRRFERPANPDREVKNAISAYNSSDLDSTIKQLINSINSLTKSTDKATTKGGVQTVSLHPTTGIVKNI